MGRYVNKLPDGSRLPDKGKVQALIKHASAKPIPTPKEYAEDLVCVKEFNGHDAAIFIYCKEEFDWITRANLSMNGLRMVTWLKVPDAEKLVV